MTFPTEEQGREAQQQEEEQLQASVSEEEQEQAQTEEETPGQEEPPAVPDDLSGEQKVEALLSVHEAISGMMAAQVENPAMAYRETLANAVAGLPRSDMPMVCNLIESGASSPEALVNAR